MIAIMRAAILQGTLGILHCLVCGLFLLPLTALASSENLRLTDPGPLVKQLLQLDQVSLNQVSSMVQGKDGFLYLAIDEKLFRFDGISLVLLAFNLSNSDSQLSAPINQLLADREGNIWLATKGNGLGRYDPHSGKITYVSNSNPHINRIAISSKAKLWLATETGVEWFNPLSQQRKLLSDLLPSAPKTINQPVTAILEDSQQRLWFGSQGQGLYRYTSDNQQLTQFGYSPQQVSGLWSNTILTIFETRQGEIWLGTSKGLNRYHSRNQAFERISLGITKNADAEVAVNAIYQDQLDNLWVATDSAGLFLLKAGWGDFKPVNHGSNQQGFLTDGGYRSILQDRSGAIWFASIGQGLFKLNPLALQFQYHSVTQPIGFSVTALLRDSNDRVWLGSDHGLYQYNIATGGLFSVKGQSTAILSMAAVKGKIWLNSERRGLVNYDPQTEQFNTLFDVTGEIPYRSLGKLTLDPQGQIWSPLLSSSNTQSGLLQLDPQHSSFQLMLPQMSITALQAIDNQLLLATKQHGLYWWNTQNKTLTAINLTQQTPPTIVRFALDSRERLWAVSESTGLARFESATGSLNFIKGLAQYGRISSLIEDRRKHLWLSSVQGLIWFVPDSERLRIFTQNDGLLMHDIANGQMLTLPNGDILMAKEQLLVRFKPNLLIKQSQPRPPQPILFSHIAYYGDDAEFLSLSNPNARTGLTFDAEQKGFAITFSSSNFAQQHKVRLAYQLMGHSDQWIETSQGQGVANFAALPTGQYLFKVKASDADGHWTANQRTLKISVAPPLWQTRIFALLLVLSVGSGLALFVRRVWAKLKPPAISAIEIEQNPQATDQVLAALEHHTDKQQKDVLVLLLEANKTITENVQIELNQYTCIEVTEVDLALNIAKQQIPDVIVANADLIAQPSCQLLDGLTADSLTNHIPVILYDSFELSEALLQQVDGFIKLPLVYDQLSKMLEHQLAVRQLRCLHWQRLFIEPDIEAGEVKRVGFDRPIEDLRAAEPATEYSTYNVTASELDKHHHAQCKFFEQLNTVLEKNLANNALTISQLASELHTSKRQLNRKMKAMSGLTPWEAIRNYRLKMAAQLLTQGGSPSTVCYETGFAAHSHFSACFKARYHCAPSAYAQRHRFETEATVLPSNQSIKTRKPK